MKSNNSTPLFVSFPRSGCIWIQAMMEIYFDKPRGPNQTGGMTWRPPKPNEDFMWNHTHDRHCVEEYSRAYTGDIFLYRNPVNAIYSLINGPDTSRKNYINEAKYFKNLMKRWTHVAKTIITYEETVKNPVETLKKMQDHFSKENLGLPYWDEQRAILAMETCSKENMLKKGDKIGSTWHNTKLIAEQYQENRINFFKKHAQEIYDIVIDEQTKPFIERVMKNE